MTVIFPWSFLMRLILESRKRLIVRILIFQPINMYKILMCDSNFSLVISYEINFGGGFQFSNCHCLDNEYQMFAVFCEKCHYNVVGFAVEAFTFEKIFS